MGRKDKPIAVENGRLLSVGAQLRRARQAQGISLTAMAERVGYTKGYLSGVENGSIRASQDLVQRYEKQLGLWSGELTTVLQGVFPVESQIQEKERPWNVPYQRNPLFTGRDEIIERIHRRLTGVRKAPRVLALTGLGGIGKTQVAIEYTYHYRTHYQAVFWLKADSSDVLLAEFANIAGCIPLPGYDELDQAIAIDAVKRWLRQTPLCLIIIDSLDNSHDLVTAAKLLSQLGESRIIITTRLQAVGVAAQALELEKMDIRDGAEFLLRRTNTISTDALLSDAPEGIRAQALEISRAMDGLPLALDQAGSYIEETGCKLSHYLSLFATQRVRLLRERGRSFIDHPDSVATTWSLIFNEIRQTSRVAADLLYLCAFLHPDAIYRDIFIEGASTLGASLRPVASDPIALDQTIGELRKYSLVQSNPHTEALTIHRLVQSVIRDTMDQKTQRLWAERTVRAINEVFPRIEVATWIETRAKCRRYFTHAQACAELIEQWRMMFVEAAQLLNKVGKYLEEISEFGSAEQAYLNMLHIDEQIDGIELDQIIKDHNDLAMLYEKQEKYKQAESHYKEALKTRQHEMAVESPSTAMTEVLKNYAGLLVKTERRSEASKLKESAAKNLQKNVRHITINDDNNAIIYSEYWEPRSDQRDPISGDYGGDEHYTDTEGASFQYTFMGVGIAIISDTTSAHGVIDIYIDDSYVQRKDTSRHNEQLPQTIIFHTAKLEAGPHTVKAELVNGAFILDALVIFTYDED